MPRRFFAIVARPIRGLAPCQSNTFRPKIRLRSTKASFPIRPLSDRLRMPASPAGRLRVPTVEQRRRCGLNVMRRRLVREETAAPVRRKEAGGPRSTCWCFAARQPGTEIRRQRRSGLPSVDSSAQTHGPPRLGSNAPEFPPVANSPREARLKHPSTTIFLCALLDARLALPLRRKRTNERPRRNQR